MRDDHDLHRGAKNYLEVARQLPRPSLAQTERFARFVSNAHSWYKHLPILPKVPFTFFLDPGAGMSFVRTPSGEMALVEISDESSRFHYTWQLTRDYRRRFGCWNYHADYGTSFLFAGDGGVVDTAGPGLRVLTDSGNWLSVPPDLAQVGTARVNAFVHPSPCGFFWVDDPDRFGLPKVLAAEDAQLPAGIDPVLRRLWTSMRQLQHHSPSLWEVRDSVPQNVIESIAQLGETRLAVMLLAPQPESWDWPGEQWLDEVQAAGVGAEWISPFIKVAEAILLRAPFERYREHQGKTIRWCRELPPESPEWPAEVVNKFDQAVIEQRATQLLGMTAAMNHFVEAVYA
jgi:hypothetical protein